MNHLISITSRLIIVAALFTYLGFGSAYAQSTTTIITADTDWALVAVYSGLKVRIQVIAPTQDTVWIRAQAAATADPTTETSGLTIGNGTNIQYMDFDALVAGDEIFARALRGTADIAVMIGDAP